MLFPLNNASIKWTPLKWTFRYYGLFCQSRPPFSVSIKWTTVHFARNANLTASLSDPSDNFPGNFVSLFGLLSCFSCFFSFDGKHKGVHDVLYWIYDEFSDKLNSLTISHTFVNKPYPRGMDVEEIRLNPIKWTFVSMDFFSRSPEVHTNETLL